MSQYVDGKKRTFKKKKSMKLFFKKFEMSARVIFSQYWTILFLFFISTKVKNSMGFDVNTDMKTIQGAGLGLDQRAIASILPYRTPEECAEINKAMTLFDDKYIPIVENTPHSDLFFALVSDPMTVLSKYLKVFLDRKDETYIIMIFIQVDDREKFKEIYNKQNTDECFDEARRKQRHPFANALKVWAKGNRADVSTTGPLDDSCLQGQWLTGEHPHWDDSRTGLEGMLMKHTIGYAQSGITCYESENPSKTSLVDDITHTIKNHDLVDLYTSLVNYIRDSSSYLAQKLHDYNEGQEDWAMWIVILTTQRGKSLKQIDEAFKKLGKKESIKDFISKTMNPDTLFTDSIQAMMDPSFKPFNYIPPHSSGSSPHTNPSPPTHTGPTNPAPSTPPNHR